MQTNLLLGKLRQITKRSRKAMRRFRRRAQITLRIGWINLRNCAKNFCINRNVYSFQARRIVSIWLNCVIFSINGDAGDPFIEDELEDEWEMRALVTRHDMPPVGLSVANLDAMLA